MTSGAEPGEQAGGGHRIAVIEIAEGAQRGGHEVGLTGRAGAGGVEIRCARLHFHHDAGELLLARGGKSGN